MNRSLALAFLATLALSGCGKFFDEFSRLNGGTTTVKLGLNGGSRQGRNANSVMTGNIMVYAVRANDDGTSSPVSAIRLADELDSGRLVLPNGRYRFLAVGWPSPGMGGTPKCGIDESGQLQDLHGQPGGVVVTIDVAATTGTSTTPHGGCDLGMFSATSYLSGGSPVAPSVVFCDATAASLAGKTYASTCSGGEESANFFLGRSASGQGVTDFRYDDVTSNIVYLADQFSLGKQELFYVGFPGAPLTFRLNSYIPTGQSVSAFEVLRGKGAVAYIADQDTAGVPELYLARPGHAGSVKISPTITATDGTKGVKEVRSTKNGNFVVFAAEVTTNGTTELYSVDVSDPTNPGPVKKLSASSPAGTGLKNWSGSNWAYEITNDDAHVVFAGKFNSSTDDELFSVAPNQTGLLQISAASSYHPRGVMDFRTNYSGSKIVWRGDLGSTTSGQSHVWVSPVATASQTELTQTPLGNGVSGQVFVSRTSDLAVFAADGNSTNTAKYSVFAADFSTGTPSVNKVYQATTSNNSFSDVSFTPGTTPSSQKFAFLTDDGYTSGTNHIYVVNDITTTTSTVDKTNSSQEPIVAGSGGDDKGPVHIVDSNYVYYLGSLSTDTGKLKLMRAPLDTTTTTPGKAANVGNTADKALLLVSGASKVFYSTDPTGGANPLPYLFDIALGTPLAAISGFSGLLQRAAEVHVPRAGESISSLFPKLIAVSGQVNASTTINDIFIKSDYTATGNAAQLSHVYNSSGGLGRYRWRLQGYRNGVPDPSQDIVSACFTTPSSDGGAASMPAIPAGLVGAGNPFRVSLDVFYESSSCGTDFITYNYTNGLANPGDSPDASVLHHTFNAGLISRIFVND